MIDYATGGVVSAGRTYLVDESGCALTIPANRRQPYLVGEFGPEEICPEEIGLDVSRHFGSGSGPQVLPVVRAEAVRLDRPLRLPAGGTEVGE